MQENIVHKEATEALSLDSARMSALPEFVDNGSASLPLVNPNTPPVELTAAEFGKLVKDITVRLKEFQELTESQVRESAKAKVEQDLGKFPEKFAKSGSTIQVSQNQIEQLLHTYSLPYELVQDIVAGCLEKSVRENELRLKMLELREEKGISVKCDHSDSKVLEAKQQLSNLLGKLINDNLVNNYYCLRPRVEDAIKKFQTQAYIGHIGLSQFKNKDESLNLIEGSWSLKKLLNPLNWYEAWPVITAVLPPAILCSFTEPVVSITGSFLSVAAAAVLFVFTALPRNDDWDDYSFKQAVKFRCMQNLTLDLPEFKQLQAMVEREGCKLKVKMSQYGIVFYADLPKLEK